MSADAPTIIAFEHGIYAIDTKFAGSRRLFSLWGGGGAMNNRHERSRFASEAKNHEPRSIFDVFRRTREDTAFSVHG
jgi:hypothetical protein